MNSDRRFHLFLFYCLIVLMGILCFTITSELRRQTAIMERWVPPEALEGVEKIEPERVEE